MFSGYYHDSFDREYRSPFGAVPVNTQVRLSIAAPSREDKITLRVWQDGQESVIEGRRVGQNAEFLIKPDSTGLIWYYFIIDGKDGRRYYGGRNGVGAVYDYPPAAYQITVYDADFSTPQWFREGVAYQIFPDRFNRGGERGGLDKIKYHSELGRKTYAHEDWNEPVIYAPINGARDYDPCDFYGGDIRGIIERLPYLHELNVTVIYLNPVFESPSNHRYNTSDYMKLDPVLGSDEDMRALVSAAREYGIRIMLDGVFSHTGDDSVYFNKYRRYANDGAYNSKKSDYFDWYDFTGYPDSYRSWWGFTTLPEVNELNGSYMKFISGVIAHYAEMGITSWRLDVADELPDRFIAFLRRTLKEKDPDGVLLGEVWDDASNKESFGARRKYVDGAELDSCMNYPFRAAIFDFLLMRTDAYGLFNRMFTLFENYPRPFYEACLNLIGSHDVPRAISVLGGAPARDALTRAEQAGFELSQQALMRGKARLLLCAMLQMSVPGVPCVYYGDEAGMTGLDDPFNRGTFPYGHEDGYLTVACKQLTSARAQSAALKDGACGFLAYDADVFAVLRTGHGECALCLVNRSETAKDVSISAEMFTKGPDAKKLSLSGVLSDALTGAVAVADGGRVNIVLPPLSGALLTSR